MAYVKKPGTAKVYKIPDNDDDIRTAIDKGYDTVTPLTNDGKNLVFAHDNELNGLENEGYIDPEAYATRAVSPAEQPPPDITGNTQGPISAGLRGLRRGASANLDDRVKAHLEALGRKAGYAGIGGGFDEWRSLTPEEQRVQDYGNDYNAKLEQERVQRAHDEESYPTSTTVGNIAGNVASTVAMGANIPANLAFGAAESLGRSEDLTSSGTDNLTRASEGAGARLGGVMLGKLLAGSGSAAPTTTSSAGAAIGKPPVPFQKTAITAVESSPASEETLIREMARARDIPGRTPHFGTNPFARPATVETTGTSTLAGGESPVSALNFQKAIPAPTPAAPVAISSPGKLPPSIRAFIDKHTAGIDALTSKEMTRIPYLTAYLKKNPGATPAELQAVWKAISK